MFVQSYKNVISYFLRVSCAVMDCIGGKLMVDWSYVHVPCYVRRGPSGGARGGSGGSLEPPPPLRPNYFIFMGNLRKK